MKVYKLTTQDLKTHGNCQWQLGKWKKTSGKGDLCGAGWLHAYESPELAVLFNSIHANVINPKLFIAEAAGSGKDDMGMKMGFSRMRLVKEIELPCFTPTQRVAFALLISYPIYNSAEWKRWALRWLDGSDRSRKSAERAVVRALAEAAEAAARSAAWTAEASEEAARSALWEAEEAEASEAAAACSATWSAARADADFPMFLNLCVEACKDF